MRAARGFNLLIILAGLILVGSLVSVALRLGSQRRAAAAEERLRNARDEVSGERLLEGTVSPRAGESVTDPTTGEEVVAYARWVSERVEPSRTPLFRAVDLELQAAPFDLVTPEGRFAVDGRPAGISDLQEVAYPGPRLVAISEGDTVSVLGRMAEGPGGPGFHGDWVLVSATVDEWLTAAGGGPFPSLPQGW